MAAKGTIERRRALRALEAKRDKLLTDQVKNRTELAKVRAELKSVRGQA
jgi:hypothetical protein